MTEIAPTLGKPWETEDDGRQYAPACERNSAAILDALKKHLPKEGLLIEIASGTGQHAVYFSPNFPTLQWQPTDLAEDKIKSITSWAKIKKIPNLLDPIKLDTTSSKWPLGNQKNVSAILCINMIHIAPFEAALGLFNYGSPLLSKRGVFCLYGPFKRNGEHTSPSNEGFDERLKGQNKNWGVRDLEKEIIPLAEKNDMELQEIIQMPANNFTVIFRKIK